MSKVDRSKEFEELRDICLMSEVRSIPNNIDKAVYVFKNYSGSTKLSQTAICEYFSCSRNSLKKRFWSKLLGQRDHTVTQSRYLSFMHEENLAAHITRQAKSLDAVTIDDLKEFVRYFNNFLF